MKRKKEYAWTDKAAGKIAGAGIKVQTKFSNGMNRLISKMPHQILKTGLIIFCLVSGGFSLYLIGHAIFGADKVQQPIQVDQVDVPKYYHRSGSEVNEQDYHVSEETYQEIQNYKQYMGSIGEPIRPGLLDSIKILEQIYQSQLK